MKYISKIEAAVKILNEKKREMTAKEIIDIALRRNLIKVKGKTPDVTLNADIINENKRRNKNKIQARFKRTSIGKWSLLGK